MFLCGGKRFRKARVEYLQVPKAQASKQGKRKPSVFVRSFGCASNVADGEVLAGCLAEAGFELAHSISEADVVVFNTCAVKGPTENRAVELLRRIPKDKRLVVAGCLPLINWQRLCSEVRFDGVVGPSFGEDIVGVVSRVLSGKRVVCLEDVAESRPCLGLPRVRVNPVVGIVPVCYGCLGVCAYCCVRFARGQLRSYNPEEVVTRIREDLDSGVREVWLTGQDLSVYGSDLGVDVASLLQNVLSIEGVSSFWARVGMMTPKGLIQEDFALCKRLCSVYSKGREESKEDAKVKKKGRLFWFLHLPVQSGDDEVLRLMRRGYNVEDFKRVVQMFRRACSNLTLATDVIVGFPSESEQAFRNTLRLIEEVKPDVVNVSKFFARPGTEAAHMVQTQPTLRVEPSEVKARSEEVSKLARRVAFEKNRAWVGWEGKILIDEKGKVKGSWVGRNYAYKPIAVKSKRNLLGEILPVRIVETHSTYLLGETVNKSVRGF